MLRLRKEESQTKLDKQKRDVYNIAETQSADYKGDGEKDKRKTT